MNRFRLCLQMYKILFFCNCRVSFPCVSDILLSIVLCNLNSILISIFIRITWKMSQDSNERKRKLNGVEGTSTDTNDNIGDPNKV
jgi:hypothetical protein